MDNFFYICVVMLVGISYAAILPNQKGDSKLDDKVKSLDSKIAQLRDLVNEIKNENEKEDTKSDWTAKESDMAASSGQSEKTNTQHASGLSPEETAILQRLKAVLEGETTERDGETTERDDVLKTFEESIKNEKKPEHIGTFMNRPIPEQKAPEPEEPDTERLKKLAALMSERSHTGREDNPVAARKQTFRENLLDVLVDKLLEDTDALLRKGFTLNDVLDNLSEKATMERERSALEQTLDKLLNQRHI
uniref:Uncharacterized protein LOC111131820 isoform X1 n=1 Tax=Crassostrea virginica TaxID=6565 RepID=A0A8B8E778_CRAVI|nr:uncharacterized protein LOC111131820 isoform X1 [Crassostrea virginica]